MNEPQTTSSPDLPVADVAQDRPTPDAHFLDDSKESLQTTKWPRRIASRLAARFCTGKGRFRVLDRLIRVPPSVRPDLHDFSTAELGACWLGHATVLLRLGEITLLTDPVLGPKIGRSAGLMTIGPTRLLRPALSIDELPPIDMVLITCDRFDHLDRPTVRQIARRFPRCQAICPSGCLDRMKDLGLRAVTEIAPQYPTEVVARGVHIRGLTSTPSHTSNRRPMAGGECGFLLARGRHRVLIAGDLRSFDDVLPIEPIDLVVVNIQCEEGNALPAESPAQAWQFCEHIGARRVMPVRHSTFHVAEESCVRPTGDVHAVTADAVEPIDRFLAAAGHAQQRVVGRKVGDTWTDLSDRSTEEPIMFLPGKLVHGGGHSSSGVPGVDVER